MSVNKTETGVDTRAIYCELDCLLDTRLATVASLDIEAAEEMMINDLYHKREHDDLGEFTTKFTSKEFHERYASRDLDILKASRPTSFLIFFSKYCRDAVNSLVDTPTTSQVNIVINHWPYKLNNDEKEAIAVILDRYAGSFINIDFISRDPLSITPPEINNLYSVMMMYNAGPWITKYAERLNSIPCTSVLFMSAPLYPSKDRIPSVSDTLVDDGEGEQPMEPFAAAELFLAPIMDIAYQDVEQYTIIH